MIFAVLLRAMGVFLVFLVFLTEIVCANSVPKAVLSVVWSGTTVNSMVFSFGTERSSAVIECWIGMADSLVTVRWKTILARFCRFLCLIPTSW